MTPSAEQDTRRSRQPRRRTSAKTDKPRDDSKVKATIVMDRKLHCLLSSIATFQGMDGSELASFLIDRGLRDRHPEMYEALEGFKPKVAKKANPVASGADKESASDAAEVSSPSPRGL